VRIITPETADGLDIPPTYWDSEIPWQSLGLPGVQTTPSPELSIPTLRHYRESEVTLEILDTHSPVDNRKKQPDGASVRSSSRIYYWGVFKYRRLWQYVLLGRVPTWSRLNDLDCRPRYSTYISSLSNGDRLLGGGGDSPVPDRSARPDKSAGFLEP